MQRPLRILFAAITLYAAWMAMMAVHESGHVLGGMLGGGRVRRVVLPPLGFSRTDVDPNPSPRLEIWSGPVWGCAVPFCLWLLLWKKLPSPFDIVVGFFTGLCLVANGAYLALGWTMSAGDAAELIKLDTPIWLLVAFGVPNIVIGFYIWHTLGSIAPLFAASKPRR